jgi:hypothetical protein
MLGCSQVSGLIGVATGLLLGALVMSTVILVPDEIRDVPLLVSGVSLAGWAVRKHIGLAALFWAVAALGWLAISYGYTAHRMHLWSMEDCSGYRRFSCGEGQGLALYILAWWDLVATAPLISLAVAAIGGAVSYLHHRGGTQTRSTPAPGNV